MNQNIPEFLSKNAYANYLGVNEKAIRKAIAEGKIVKGWDADKKKVNVLEADKEYGFLHQSATAKAGISKLKRAEKITAKTTGSPKGRVGLENEKSESPKSGKIVLQDLDIDDDPTLDLNYETLLLKIPVHDKLDYKETVRRREILQLALDKKKLEELEGVLLRKSDVSRVLNTLGTQLKKALAAIPARCIDDVRNADSKVEGLNFLNEELNSVLEIFANFDEVKLEHKNK